MINVIDTFLNYITMYRLILYYLIGLLIAALILSVFHILPFTPMALILSTLFLVLACWAFNTIFAKVFHAQTNFESVYISSLILACILSPMKTPHDLIFFGWAALWTIASKYIVTINRKHIFNPVAFGVWITGLGLQHYASWWIGTAYMLPLVLIGGFLIVKKMRREDMVFSFFIASLVTISIFSVISGHNVVSSLQKSILEAPLFFFAFVMLTEPLTTPPTKILQILYGIFTGFLISPQVQLAGIHTTPETTLLLGNIFSYLVSPKTKLFLHLKQRVQNSSNIFDFIFTVPKRISFTPGQYMEWTLSYPHPDSRGNRRYFTIASSPTEKDMIIGVRVDESRSTFKNALYNLPHESEIVASQIAGDFVLPENPHEKLVFLGGGIGITPFRSMIKYLLDTNEKRDVVLFYAAKLPTELVYRNIFDQAQKVLGIKVVYTITDTEHIPPNWSGKTGRIDAKMIMQEVLDYKERTFYLSGPNSMVKSYEQSLKALGVPKKQIKQDYFPGFV